MGGGSGMSDVRKRMSPAGFFYAVSAGVLWGVGAVLAQYEFQTKGISQMWLVPYRLLIGGVGLLLAFAIKNKGFGPALQIWRDKKDWLRLLAFGIFGMLSMQFCYFTAIRYSNAATATVFEYLSPALMMCFYCVVRKHLPARRDVFAVVLAITGILLIATHGEPGNLELSVKGICWCLSCAFASSFHSILPIPLLSKYPAMVVSGWGMIIGGVVLSIAARPWYVPKELDGEVVAAFAGIIVLGTFIPFVTYLLAVERIGAVYSGMLASLELVSSTVLGRIFMGTRFQIPDFAGFFLILCMVFILALGGRGREK